MNKKLKLLRTINCIICVGVAFLLIGCSKDKVEEAISNDFQYLIEQVDEPYKYKVRIKYNDDLYQQNKIRNEEEYTIKCSKEEKNISGIFYKLDSWRFWPEGDLMEYYHENEQLDESFYELMQSEAKKVESICSKYDLSKEFFSGLEVIGYNYVSLIHSEYLPDTDAIFYKTGKQDKNLLVLSEIFTDLPISDNEIIMKINISLGNTDKLRIENTYFLQDSKQTEVTLYAYYDTASLDLNDRPVYNLEREKKQFQETPYFTEDKLSRLEVEILNRSLYIFTDPYLDPWSGFITGYCLQEYNYKDWPDYSYVELYDTPVTDNKVEELNKLLFKDNGQLNKEAKEVAKELGFSKNKLITTEWILQHPKDATSIIKGTDVFQQQYEKIFGDDTNEDNLQYLKEWNCFQH